MKLIQIGTTFVNPDQIVSIQTIDSPNEYKLRFTNGDHIMLNPVELNQLLMILESDN